MRLTKPMIDLMFSLYRGGPTADGEALDRRTAASLERRGLAEWRKRGLAVVFSLTEYGLGWCEGYTAGKAGGA